MKTFFILDKNYQKAVLLSLIEEFPHCILVDDELKKDKKFILEAINKNPNVLQYADFSLQNDQQFMLTAISQNALTFNFSSNMLQEDFCFIAKAVIQNIDVVKFTRIADINSSKYISDIKKILKEVIKNTNYKIAIKIFKKYQEKYKDDVTKNKYINNISDDKYNQFKKKLY